MTRDPNAFVPGMRGQVRSGLPLLAGVGAALLCNFWVLEDLLAKRSDLSGSWISDLAARSQVYGWRFQLLEIASGLAVAAFAWLLLRRQGDRSREIRNGLLALFAAGILVAIGGAAPLNCAEALERACELSYDPFDLLHTAANLLEVAAVTIAFALIGLGLSRLPSERAAGRATLAIGALWLALAAASALTYVGVDTDSVKGLCQRADQVLFGAWLVLLSVRAESGRATSPTWSARGEGGSRA